MPIYDVIAVGFYGKKMYGPNTKRSKLVTDTVLDPEPSWLKRRGEETPAQRKVRLAAEKKQARANAEKASSDKVDRDSVTFIESSGVARAAGVTTL